MIRFYLPVFYGEDSFGVASHFPVVGDQDNGRPLFPVKPVKRFHDFHAVFGIQIARRLIRQNYFGIVYQGTGDSHSLLFTS